MTLLAIPPILVDSYAGLREVDRDLIEAGRGMGMRESQILRGIEVPLASPIIIGGFRTATLQVIATATIGAILSDGGLGRFIIDGIARSEPDMLFAGAVLVTVLALLVDASSRSCSGSSRPKALRGGGGTRPPEQMDETVVDPGMLGVPVTELTGSHRRHSCETAGKVRGPPVSPTAEEDSMRKAEITS